jgi:hypothetical protein
LVFTALVVVAGGTYAIDSLLQGNANARRRALEQQGEKNSPRMYFMLPLGSKEKVFAMRPPFHPDGDPAAIEAAVYEAFEKSSKGFPTDRKGKEKSKLAPDFCLANIVTGEKVRLAQFQGKKPVVLLFGSFGCDLFCAQLESLEQMYQGCKDRAEFLFVYISEAPHKVIPKLPSEDKESYIKRGLAHFRLTIPCVVADDSGLVEEAYSPFPLRFAVVNREGKICLETRKSKDVGSWLKKQSVKR